MCGRACGSSRSSASAARTVVHNDLDRYHVRQRLVPRVVDRRRCSAFAGSCRRRGLDGVAGRAGSDDHDRHHATRRSANSHRASCRRIPGGQAGRIAIQFFVATFVHAMYALRRSRVRGRDPYRPHDNDRVPARHHQRRRPRALRPPHRSITSRVSALIELVGTHTSSFSTQVYRGAVEYKTEPMPGSSVRRNQYHHDRPRRSRRARTADPCVSRDSAHTRTFVPAARHCSTCSGNQDALR